MTVRSCSLFAFFVLLTVYLVGCANPAELSNLSDEEIREVSHRNLCEAYHYGKADNVRNEINRRNLINERRWSQVDANKITTGMTDCAIFAALGNPKKIVAKTSDDPHKLFIYQREGTLINIYYDDNRVAKIERKTP